VENPGARGMGTGIPYKASISQKYQVYFLSNVYTFRKIDVFAKLLSWFIYYIFINN